MTHDEIDKMEGRELDRAVAEKVMGWTRVDGYLPADTAWWDGEKERWLEPPNNQQCWNEFQPSTDIAAAWEVVEKLVPKERGHAVVIQWNGEWCGVKFTQYSKKFTSARTAPLAISRAALKAVTKKG